MTHRFYHSLCVLGSLVALWSCKSESLSSPTKEDEVKPPEETLERSAFNQAAVELHLPLYWINDVNESGTVEADELAVLWGVGSTGRSAWVNNGKLTAEFQRAWKRIGQVVRKGHDFASLPSEERTRQQLLERELQQGHPTLIYTDFSQSSESDRKLVQHILRAAHIVEGIYARQRGVHGMSERIPEEDTLSRAVFQRNQGPWCVAPKTEGEEVCTAIVPKPERDFGLYPAPLQKQEDFCNTLAQKAEPSLVAPFSVVGVDNDGKMIAVPYTTAYQGPMEAAARELESAAKVLEGSGEEAFRHYLRAAARAFRDNNWEPADEAWAAMNVDNSKWYLRIGPDEVYFEPCSLKAGFHVSFARINQGSLAWQRKLDPVKGDMEKALAKLAGAPYKAREVSFHLPDFIDIVINAGDARNPHGGTIGQSLPNWGPVANEGRGRTVAMTNLYTDEDSKKTLRSQVASLFCPSTMKFFTEDKPLRVMSTVLHEAAHNLGPAHEYEVGGKTASAIFGGPMASMLEELKAQSSSLYLSEWLATRGVITQQEAQQAHVGDIAWAFGHIARGMYTSTGKSRPYSQLAAIQVGYLMNEGALAWKPELMAQNGKDKGCMDVDLAAMAKSIPKLMGEVAGIKARGDKPAAEGLKKRYVDSEGHLEELRALIQERWLRAPKASFVYAVRLGETEALHGAQEQDSVPHAKADAGK